MAGHAAMTKTQLWVRSWLPPLAQEVVLQFLSTGYKIQSSHEQLLDVASITWFWFYINLPHLRVEIHRGYEMGTVRPYLTPTWIQVLLKALPLSSLAEPGGENRTVPLHASNWPTSPAGKMKRVGVKRLHLHCQVHRGQSLCDSHYTILFISQWSSLSFWIKSYLLAKACWKVNQNTVH